jgi:hypothetical protein
VTLSTPTSEEVVIIVESCPRMDRISGGVGIEYPKLPRHEATALSREYFPTRRLTFTSSKVTSTNLASFNFSKGSLDT